MCTGLIYGLGGLCHHKYYYSVPHICPLFCNLSDSRKHGGGGFYLTNMPPFLGPRLDVDIGTLYYRPLQKLVWHRSAFSSVVLMVKIDWQSVDGVVLQALRGLTPLTDMLVIVGEFLSWSVDAGFVLVLPLHHGNLELDSVGVLMKDHVAILVAWPWLEAYLRDKNTGARSSTENVGGLYTKGSIYAGHYGIFIISWQALGTQGKGVGEYRVLWSLCCHSCSPWFMGGLQNTSTTWQSRWTWVLLSYNILWADIKLLTWKHRISSVSEAISA